MANFEDKKYVGGDAKYQEKQGGETPSYEEVQKKGAAKGWRKKRAARSGSAPVKDLLARVAFACSFE